jgi:ribonuclease P protein subunit RPR2
MGKQNKDDIPNPSRVGNRDIIQRLNFLYQASVLLNGMTAGSSSQVPFSTCETNDMQNPPKKRQKRVVSTADLSRSYVDTMKIVGQKTNVKM